MVRGLLFTLALLMGVSLHARAEDCRAQIAAKVCVIDPPNKTGAAEFSYTRLPCLPGSAKYAPFFEGHYDRSIKIIQKMYCHVEKIMVSTYLPGSAVSLYNRLVGGAYIGVRKDLLDKPLTLDQWLSWRDETSFGGSLDTKANTLGLINYKSNKNTVEFGLDFLLNHEIGHLLDYANNVGQEWGSLSWRDQDHPLSKYDFDGRDGLCFYFCNGSKLPANQSAVILKGVMSSPFATPYAATGFRDDWADTFAFYAMNKTFGLTLQIETQGQVFDLTQHLYSPQLQEKRDFLESFLRGDINYP